MAPALVTLKIRRGRGDLRSAKIFPHVENSLRLACERERFRIVQYSVQHDHVHLICEADSSTELASGIQGLCVRISRGVNKVLGTSGKLFKDRYHSTLLRNPRAVRESLAYVLLNGHKHFTQLGCEVPPTWIDPCSSSLAFDGWLEKTNAPPPIALPAAQSWLLGQGWRRHGLISRIAPRAW